MVGVFVSLVRASLLWFKKSNSIEKLTPTLYKMSYLASVLKQNVFLWKLLSKKMRSKLNPWKRWYAKVGSYLVWISGYASTIAFLKNCCMSFGTQPWHAIKWHKRISKGHLILKDISWKDMYTLCNNKHSTFLPKPTLPSSLRPVNSVPGEKF